jgi:poly-gamma-glutamate capsule biosynthesis protein CapA/YwtB (metallophosphatase superfamily)
LNIANFEAALTDDLTSSPLQGIKPYIHGGKIEESILTLQKYNINIVTLGNDHAMDFGVDGINSTIKALETGGIQYIGAGYNCKAASEPVRIQIGNYEIIIFNGYWYEESEHNIYESYALGIKPGVACINGELTERIKEEKRKSADSFIITIVHWGSDFENVLPSQRTYAKQLVESGTDLIIGHGSHMMQEIQQVNDKWVVYDIGNGIFNSNDKCNGENKPTYSFFLQLNIKNNTVKSILLYPILSDNLGTFCQTRMITQDQFNEVISYQNKIGTPMKKLGIGVDEFGGFIKIPLA